MKTTSLPVLESALMSHLITTALIVPVQKSSTDGDFEPVVIFNSVVVIVYLGKVFERMLFLALEF